MRESHRHRAKRSVCRNFRHRANRRWTPRGFALCRKRHYRHCRPQNRLQQPYLARHASAARSHADCVEQLLFAGARCVGKTVSDEVAFSLIGENHFYGTPLNPKAPDRVPGGSSSGSASAVACGLADFALGTDTGGSVRVPASNCGIWGLRPSHGFISVAGVMPFAPRSIRWACMRAVPKF